MKTKEIDLECLLTTLTLIIVYSTYMIKQIEHRLACCPMHMRNRNGWGLTRVTPYPTFD